MSEIIDEILKHIPKNKVSEAGFEGANIVLYTKDKDFFLENNGLIKKIVHEIKKRIELRPDPSITVEPERAEKEIRNLVPEEAGLCNVIFDPNRSRVIIEAEKPGLAIGKQGSILRDIRAKTLWVPHIRRTAPIKTDIVDNIRMVLYNNSEYRRKFLDNVGHRIYDGWIRGKKDEWIRVTTLGGGRQVGRSSLFVHTPESRVLLDCGIDVAANDHDQYPHLEAPEFKIEELDAVVITHSHLDHCGLVPWLFKMGYRGPVYCTMPTRDVMGLMLLDLIKIARGENKDPLFSVDDVKEMVKHTICLDYEEVTDITPDIRLTLYNAGHNLGSAMAHLHIGNGLHNLLYTGDLKFANTGLLSAAHSDFPRLETLIVESTYGARDNVLPPQKEGDGQLKDIVINTINRKGKVLIPTLGSGRAQEIMVMIEQLVRTKQIPETPVYIDGLVWDVTAIHTAYPEFMNNSVRKMIFHKDANPFLSPIFKRVGSKKERRQLIEEEGSCIVLATSGMLVGGPSIEYLREFAENKNNSLVFSCYQAEGSLGRRIQSGEREIIFKSGNKQEIVEIKMEVLKVEITGHSDRKQLMNYVHRINPKPKKVMIVHGENSRCLDLASSIHKACRVETVAPRNLEAHRLK
ncbi:MAG: beta-CASP ribonuclease aCPSF1 [Candidatus Woesearchaeota archaeon]